MFLSLSLFCFVFFFSRVKKKRKEKKKRRSDDGLDLELRGVGPRVLGSVDKGDASSHALISSLSVYLYSN